MDRDYLARLMAAKGKQMPKAPTMDEIIAAGSQPDPPEQQGPWNPAWQPQWHPTPTQPFAGLGTFDWKNMTDRTQPLSIGSVGPGPSAEDLQILHRLGRRRLPHELSGVGR